MVLLFSLINAEEISLTLLQNPDAIVNNIPNIEMPNENPNYLITFVSIINNKLTIVSNKEPVDGGIMANPETAEPDTYYKIYFVPSSMIFDAETASQIFGIDVTETEQLTSINGKQVLTKMYKTSGTNPDTGASLDVSIKTPAINISGLRDNTYFIFIRQDMGDGTEIVRAIYYFNKSGYGSLQAAPYVLENISSGKAIFALNESTGDFFNPWSIIKDAKNQNGIEEKELISIPFDLIKGVIYKKISSNWVKQKEVNLIQEQNYKIDTSGLTTGNYCLGIASLDGSFLSDAFAFAFRNNAIEGAARNDDCLIQPFVSRTLIQTTPEQALNYFKQAINFEITTAVAERQNFRIDDDAGRNTNSISALNPTLGDKLIYFWFGDPSNPSNGTDLSAQKLECEANLKALADNDNYLSFQVEGYDYKLSDIVSRLNSTPELSKTQIETLMTELEKPFSESFDSRQSANKCEILVHVDGSFKNLRENEIYYANLNVKVADNKQVMPIINLNGSEFNPAIGKSEDFCRRPVNNRICFESSVAELERRISGSLKASQIPSSSPTLNVEVYTGNFTEINEDDVRGTNNKVINAKIWIGLNNINDARATRNLLPNGSVELTIYGESPDPVQVNNINTGNDVSGIQIGSLPRNKVYALVAKYDNKIAYDLFCYGNCRGQNAVNERLRQLIGQLSDNMTGVSAAAGANTSGIIQDITGGDQERITQVNAEINRLRSDIFANVYAQMLINQNSALSPEEKQNKLNQIETDIVTKKQDFYRIIQGLSNSTISR